MNKEQAIAIAERGVQYLARQVKASGQFVYLRKADGTEQEAKYNILRHAGSVWAMKTVREMVPSQLLNYAVEKALEYLNKHIHQHEQNQSSAWICERGQCKLGGSALAILAFGRGHPQSDRLYYGLNWFITASGQDLWHKTKTDGTPKVFRSEYYPGEVALALAYLDAYEQAWNLCRWVFCTRDYLNQPVQDHWMLQALRALYTKEAIQGTGLGDFALKYAELIVREIFDNQYWMERVTPTACRVEGLISYYEMTLNKTIRSYIELLLGGLAQYQDRSGGVMDGAFVDGGVSRIDYTQHNISAFIRYAIMSR